MALSATRSSFVPGGTSTVCAPAGASSPSAASASRMVVRASPAGGTPPHVVWRRPEPPCVSIQGRYAATFASKVKSPARQSALRPPDAMPATTVPKPESTNSGPPEWPLDEFEPVPVKFQQTAVPSEMPSVQGAVVIAPEASSPTPGGRPPVRRKPAVVADRPGAGGG